MSMLGEVFGGLNAMSLSQLLSAFIACIGYGLAQGGMLSPKGRATALSAMVLGIAGFAFQGSDWVRALMLSAFAIAGFGIFTGIVWLTCRTLGIDGTAVDSVTARPTPDAAPAKTSAQPHLGSPPVASA